MSSDRVSMTVVVPNAEFAVTMVGKVPSAPTNNNVQTQVRRRCRQSTRHRHHSLDSSSSKTSRSTRSLDCYQTINVSENRFQKNYEVRFFMTDLKTYIEKIRNTYSCDPFECPSIKQRLERHRIMYHPEEHINCPQVAVRTIDVGPSSIRVVTHNKSIHKCISIPQTRFTSAMNNLGNNQINTGQCNAQCNSSQFNNSGQNMNNNNICNTNNNAIQPKTCTQCNKIPNQNVQMNHNNNCNTNKNENDSKFTCTGCKQGPNPNLMNVGMNVNNNNSNQRYNNNNEWNRTSNKKTRPVKSFGMDINNSNRYVNNNDKNRRNINNNNLNDLNLNNDNDNEMYNKNRNKNTNVKNEIRLNNDGRSMKQYNDYEMYNKNRNKNTNVKNEIRSNNDGRSMKQYNDYEMYENSLKKNKNRYTNNNNYHEDLINYNTDKQNMYKNNGLDNSDEIINNTRNTNNNNDIGMSNDYRYVNNDNENGIIMVDDSCKYSPAPDYKNYTGQRRIEKMLSHYRRTNEYGLEMSTSERKPRRRVCDIPIHTPCCDRRSCCSNAASVDPCSTISMCELLSSSPFDITITTNQHAVSHPPNVYETYLHEEVNDWLKKVPFYPNDNPCAEQERRNNVSAMIEKIKALVDQVDDDNYIELVKKEINKCIDNLHIWYPGAKRDQTSWKDSICDSLLRNIGALNKLFIRDKKCGDFQKYLSQFCRDKCTSIDKVSASDKSVRRSNSVCDGDMCRAAASGPCRKPCKSCKFELDYEIRKWLNQANILQPFDVISTKDITAILANKVSPHLFKPYHPINKIQIKSQIIDTLNSLPICANCMSNHKIITMRHAEQLTDRLLCFQTRLENKNLRCNFNACLNSDKNDESESFLEAPKQAVYTGPRVYCDEVPQVKKKEFSIGNNLTDFLNEEIKFCLENTLFEFDKRVEKAILNILLKNVEEIRDGNDNRAKVELFYLFQDTGKLTITETLNLVKYVICNVQEVINLNLSQNNNKKKPLNPMLLFSYRSVLKQRNKICMPVTFLSITSEVSPSSQLSVGEQNFLNNIANIIKDWINTINSNTLYKSSETKKTEIVQELSNSILEETQLQRLKPNPSAVDKQKIWRKLIYNWLYKYRVFDTMNEAEGKVAVLIKKLKSVPVPVTSYNQLENLITKSNLGILEAERNPNKLAEAIDEWVKEQPPGTFSNNLKKSEKALAKQVIDSVSNKKAIGIKYDVRDWLIKEVKNKDSNIEALTDDLANKLFNMERIHLGTSILLVDEELDITKDDTIIKDLRDNYTQTDPGEDIKGVILKYIDKSDDIDDLVARKASVLILARKLQKLNKEYKTDLYDTESRGNRAFSIEMLEEELRYIAIISDWLKLYEILCNFKDVGNKDRIKFILDLVNRIAKLESSWSHRPGDRNYYNVLRNVIIDSLSTVPFSQIDVPKIPQMADELTKKVTSQSYLPLRLNMQTQGNKTPEQRFSAFLEDYLHVNRDDISKDPLKLDAVSKRITDEIKLIESLQTDDKLDNFFMLYPVRRIESELKYCKEICEWLKNLPLRENSFETQVKMVNDLAEKVYMRDMRNGADDADADKVLVDYVEKWISNLPLEPSNEVVIPIAARQLIRRIDETKIPNSSTKKDKHKRSKSLPPFGTSKSNCKWFNIQLCKKKVKPAGIKNAYVVDVIEKNCDSLPLKVCVKKADAKKIKLDLANNLYHSIDELNTNPIIFNNDDLYRNTLADEIVKQLNKIPNKYIYQGDKNKFKKKLLEKIMAAKTVIEYMNAGHIYEQRLEQTIETSMPTPVQDVRNDPGFEIYKHRLAEMFILENFDHSNQAVKLKYEKQIQKEIDKYFSDAQKRNASPMNRQQLQNELYGALFQVPIPNEESLSDEVEEVKTRSEVDQWLNELPLREPTGMGELLEWDQILTALTKKIHEIEKKNEPNREKKLNDEISKWLQKLPLLPGSNTEELIRKLSERLKATVGERKCVMNDEGPSNNKLSKNVSSNRPNTNNARRKWSMPASMNTSTEYKSIDLLIDTVETWASQLPLPASSQAEEENNNVIRDVITTNIIMKISEFNSNPDIFDNIDLYSKYIDREIETVLTSLPQTEELRQSKNERKCQLKEAIIHLRPDVLEDRNKYQYKNELQYVLINTLKQPIQSNEKEASVINKLNDEIIEGFIEYKHGYDDNISRAFHRNKIEKAVAKYLQQIDVEANKDVDKLMKANKVITELSKVHPTNPVTIVEDIQLIRMKNEVRAFLREYLPEVTDSVTNLRNELSKELYNIEKAGHTKQTEEAMKDVIRDALKKLNKEEICNEIDVLVKKLRDNEAARKLIIPKLLGTAIHESAFDSNRPDTGVRVNLSPDAISVRSILNGSDLNASGFANGVPGSISGGGQTNQGNFSGFSGQPSNGQAVNAVSVPNETAASYFPFDESFASTENSLNYSGFEAWLPAASSRIEMGTQPSRPINQGQGTQSEFLSASAQNALLPPCYRTNPALGVQANQNTNSASQNTSTEWMSLQQGTRIENLSGFRDLSLGQPNTFRDQTPMIYSRFAVGTSGSSPMGPGQQMRDGSTVQQTPTEWLTLSQGTAIQNLPGFQDQSLFQDEQPDCCRVVVPSCCAQERSHQAQTQNINVTGLAPRSILQNSPVSYVGSARSGQTVTFERNDVQPPPCCQNVVVPLNTLPSLGSVQDPSRQAAALVHQLPNATGFTTQSMSQNSPVSYAGFAGGGQTAPSSIQGAQQISSPNGTQWVSLEQGTAIQNLTGFQGSPEEPSDPFGGFGNRTALPPCCSPESYSRFGAGVPMASSPNQAGPGTELDSFLGGSFPSYSGFADDAQFASSPIRQTPVSDSRAYSSDETRLVTSTVSQGTPISYSRFAAGGQLASSPIRVDTPMSYSGFAAGGQGASSPVRVDTPMSYSGFAAGGQGASSPIRVDTPMSYSGFAAGGQGASSPIRVDTPMSYSGFAAGGQGASSPIRVDTPMPYSRFAAGGQGASSPIRQTPVSDSRAYSSDETRLVSSPVSQGTPISYSRFAAGGQLASSPIRVDTPMSYSGFAAGGQGASSPIRVDTPMSYSRFAAGGQGASSPIRVDMPMSYSGFAAGGQGASSPKRVDTPMSYSGFAAGGQGASSPIRVDTPMSYSGFAAGGQGASSPIRVDTPMSYSGFAGGGQGASSPIRVDMPMSYSRFAGGGQGASSPIRVDMPMSYSRFAGGGQGASSPIRVDMPMSYSRFAAGGQPASSPISQGTSIQNLPGLQNASLRQPKGAVNFSFNDTSYIGWPISEQVPSQMQNIPVRDSRFVGQSGFPPFQPAIQQASNVNESQWVSLEQGTPIQNLSGFQNTPVSGSSFAGGQTGPSQIQPVIQQEQQSSNVDGTQWVSIQQGTLIKNLPGFQNASSGQPSDPGNASFNASMQDSNQSQLTYSRFARDVVGASTRIVNGSDQATPGTPLPPLVNDTEPEWVSLLPGSPIQNLPGMQDYYTNQPNQNAAADCCTPQPPDCCQNVVPWNTQSSLGSVQEPSKQAVVMVHQPPNAISNMQYQNMAQSVGGSTVVPWNIQSSMGSVQEPSKQAVGMLHLLPNTGDAPYSSLSAQNASYITAEQIRQTQLPMISISPAPNTDPIYGPMAPSLGSYQSPYQNQMPNYDTKASMQYKESYSKQTQSAPRVSFAEPGATIPVNPYSEKSTEEIQKVMTLNRSESDSDCRPRQDGVCDPCPYDAFDEPYNETCRNSRFAFDDFCMCRRRRRRFPVLQYCDSIDDFLPMCIPRPYPLRFAVF